MEAEADRWKLRAIGVVVGAAVAVATGSYGVLQLQGSPSKDPPTPAVLIERLAAIEAMVRENRNRIEAIERPGGTVPMSREARERFESVDRALADVQRQLAANTVRIDAIVAERRGK